MPMQELLPYCQGCGQGRFELIFVSFLLSNAASVTTTGSFELLHYYVYGLAFLPLPPCLAGWQNEEAVNINLNVMMLLYSKIIYNQ